MALNPRHAVAYSNRAMALLRMNEYLQAEEDASAAIEIQVSMVEGVACGLHRRYLWRMELRPPAGCLHHTADAREELSEKRDSTECSG